MGKVGWDVIGGTLLRRDARAVVGKVGCQESLSEAIGEDIVDARWLTMTVDGAGEAKHGSTEDGKDPRLVGYIWWKLGDCQLGGRACRVGETSKGLWEVDEDTKKGSNGWVGGLWQQGECMWCQNKGEGVATFTHQVGGSQ